MGIGNTGPSLVGAAFRITVNHHVLTFLVSEYTTFTIRQPAWDSSDAIKRSVTSNTVKDSLTRRCFQRLFVSTGDRLNGGAEKGTVAGRICCIKRAFVVVRGTDIVQLVNSIGTNLVGFPKVGGTMGSLVGALDLVQWMH